MGYNNKKIIKTIFTKNERVSVKRIIFILKYCTVVLINATSNCSTKSTCSLIMLGTLKAKLQAI